MSTVAKIISLMIVIDGLFLLFFPSSIKKMMEYFNKIKSIKKRLIGLLQLVIGVILLYLTRVYLVTLLPHWIIAVTGIILLLKGIFLFAVPTTATKVVVWYVKEKGCVSLTGFILLLGGIILFINLWGC